jgi:hypothetical protein
MFTLIKTWRFRPALAQVVGGFLLGACLVASAQPAGEVEFAQGVGFTQTPGQLPRTLGKGQILMAGDRLTTAPQASAIIKLTDGSRMTLRPDSEIIVQEYRFKESASDNSMVLNLLRGGLRAVTGALSKGSPDAVKIQTANATVGIHGTDFDARVCGAECKGESAKITEKPRPNAIAASAKLISAQGEISAIDGQEVKRRLVDGGSVYPGETVETGAGAKGVLVFRDDSRITMGGSTRFKVDSFVFDDKNPAEGKAMVSLLRGSMRALTGLIGKADKRNVRFTTPTATIGIRGTGLDLDCIAIDSCSFFTWQGVIEVTQIGQTTSQVLEAGQGLFVSRTVIRPLTAPTLERLERPDLVPVDMRQLFSSGDVPADEVGLFVYVRDGHIQVTSSSQTLQLGRGETGFVGNDGRAGRPLEMPLFIQFDRVPLPNSPNPMLLSILGQRSSPLAELCR